MKIHSDVLDHMCTFCGRGFMRKSDCNRHQQRYCSERPSNNTSRTRARVTRDWQLAAHESVFVPILVNQFARKMRDQFRATARESSLWSAASTTHLWRAYCVHRRKCVTFGSISRGTRNAH
jgi:hypothetical protein